MSARFSTREACCSLGEGLGGSQEGEGLKVCSELRALKFKSLPEPLCVSVNPSLASTQDPALKHGSLIFPPRHVVYLSPSPHSLLCSFLFETAPEHPESLAPHAPSLPSSSTPSSGAGLSQGTASSRSRHSPLSLWPRSTSPSFPFCFHPPHTVLLSGCLTESVGARSAHHFPYKGELERRGGGGEALPVPLRNCEPTGNSWICSAPAEILKACTAILSGGPLGGSVIPSAPPSPEHFPALQAPLTR